VSSLLSSVLVPFLFGAATGGWWSRRRAVRTAVAAAVAEATASASARAGHVIMLGGSGHSPDDLRMARRLARELDDYDDGDDPPVELLRRSDRGALGPYVVDADEDDDQAHEHVRRSGR
jgi:hypothetical protein